MNRPGRGPVREFTTCPADPVNPERYCTFKIWVTSRQPILLPDGGAASPDERRAPGTITRVPPPLVGQRAHFQVRIPKAPIRPRATWRDLPSGGNSSRAIVGEVDLYHGRRMAATVSRIAMPVRRPPD